MNYRAELSRPGSGGCLENMNPHGIHSGRGLAKETAILILSRRPGILPSFRGERLNTAPGACRGIHQKALMQTLMQRPVSASHARNEDVSAYLCMAVQDAQGLGQLGLPRTMVHHPSLPARIP